MINHLRRFFFPVPVIIPTINYKKLNMALKNTNKTASFATLSNNLVTALDHLANGLSESCNDAARASIFAAARQMRITARAAGIQSRFDRQVATMSNGAGSVFNDYDYNFTKWSNGTLSPVRG